MRRSIAQILSFDFIAKLFIGLATILIIRFSSTEQYALYVAAMAMVTLMENVLNASNHVYVVGYNRLPACKNERAFLTMEGSLILVGMLVLLPLLRVEIMISVGVMMFLLSKVGADFLKAKYQREERFGSFSKIEITRSSCFLCFLSIVILGVGSEIKAWQILFIQALGLLIAFSIFKTSHQGKFFSLDLRGGLNLIGIIWKSKYRYLVLHISSLALINQLGVFMLQFLSHPMEVATYGSAFRYYAVLALGLNSVQVVLLPLVVKAPSREELDKLYQRYTGVAMFFIFLTAVGMVLCEWIIPFIDKGKYPEAVKVFRIFSIAAIMAFIFRPYGHLLFRYERFSFLLKLNLVGAALGITLNWILIPRYGAVGTAYVMLMNYTLLNLGAFFYSRFSHLKAI